MIVKSRAEVANTAPAPSKEAVMANKSPIRTPGMVAQAVLRPPPKAWEITRITVGPGMISKAELARMKAIQMSIDMADFPFEL